MIKLLMTSPPDRERVVAELWIGDVQLAEVSNEDGAFRVELYTPLGSNRVEVRLDELEEALRKARADLTY